MKDHPSAAIDELPQPPDRKAWTPPVVTFLSIDETALSSRGGDDGNGSTTAS